MTVLGARIELLKFFLNKDILCLQDDLHQITNNNSFIEIIPDNKAAFCCALDELQKTEFVDRTQIDNKIYYILKQPLEYMPQTITISGLTSLQIASIVNATHQSLGGEGDLADPNAINENDILNLLRVIELIDKNTNSKPEQETKKTNKQKNNET